MNFNPRFSPVWRFLAANLTSGLLAGAAYITQNPQVLTDPAAQSMAAIGLLSTALSWVLGANLPKPGANP